jgi:hypothetical protein
VPLDVVVSTVMLPADCEAVMAKLELPGAAPPPPLLLMQ